MLGNLAAYFVLPHVSKGLLFAVFTSIAAAGAATLLLLRRITAHDEKYTFGSLSNEDDFDEVVGKAKRFILSRRIKTAVKLVFGSIWWDIVVLFPSPHILMLCPMFFWTGFELAFWTGEFPQLLESSVLLRTEVEIHEEPHILGRWVRPLASSLCLQELLKS